MAFSRTILVFLSFLTYFCCQIDAVDVTVSTPVGDFIGLRKTVTVDGSSVQLSTFFGIPYAEPPVGELRFRKPVAKAPLTSPMVAHVHGPECIQVHMFGYHRPSSEDCLFLNIYAPEKLPNQDDLAVMIFIHGGGYFTGSSNIFVSDLLAARGNVIVVTINYRLSVLGFLNARDNGESNFGLWDQHLAIKWVHDNIRSFGGDNERITIFGESAGGGSVIYQGLYPGNKGLFQRIIAESGTADAQWGVSLQPKAEAREFASLVGCNYQSTATMISCLSNISVTLINETLNDFSNGLARNPMPFVPSPDNEFSPISPRITLNTDEANVMANEPRSVFAEFDLMMGVNSGEGIALLSPVMGVEGDPELFLPSRSYFENTLIPICAKSEYGKDVSDGVIEALINRYIPWDDPENPYELRERFLDMHGDVQFLTPTVNTIELYTDVSNKDPYLYYFTATPSSSSVSPSWANRPNHGEELFYVFGEVNKLHEWGYLLEFTEWEKQLSRRMMTMWSNFAKTGNPNLPRDVGADWLPYTAAHHYYLDIGRFENQTEIKERLFEARAHLWNKVLPAIHAETSTKMCGTDEISGAESTLNSAIVSIFVGTALMVTIAFI